LSSQPLFDVLECLGSLFDFGLSVIELPLELSSEIELLLGLPEVEPFVDLQLSGVEHLVELELPEVELFLELPVLSEIELLLGFSGFELFLELQLPEVEPFV